jgi:hypothetical protein
MQFIMHKSVVADPCSMYSGAYPRLSLLVGIRLVGLHQLQCMDPAKEVSTLFYPLCVGFV